MNIAKIMIPKISTVFLYEKDTIRQGLERFMVHGYSVDDSYRYVVKNKIGTVYGTWLYRCPGTE